MSGFLDLGGHGDSGADLQANGSSSTSTKSSNSTPALFHCDGYSSFEDQELSYLFATASTSDTSVTTSDNFDGYTQLPVELSSEPASVSDFTTEPLDVSSNTGSLEKFNISSGSQYDDMMKWDGNEEQEPNKADDEVPTSSQQEPKKPQPKPSSDDEEEERMLIHPKVGILLLSHLSQFVTKKDIMKEFSHFGQMKYFRMSNSIIGYYIREQWQTAVLVYKKKHEAIMAYQHNQNMEMKGLYIHIELVTSDSRADVQRWACKKIGMDMSVADESSDEESNPLSDLSFDEEYNAWAKQNIIAQNKLKNWLINMAL